MRTYTNPYPTMRRNTARLTVVRAWNQSGWSSCDHLLDDSRLSDMIGRTYTSFARMTASADKRAASFAWVEYVGPDGDRYLYDGSATAGIPGRHVQRVQRLTEDREDDRGRYEREDRYSARY